jgi:hypothetical protein
MPALTPISVPVSSVTKNLVVHVRVTGVKVWRVRLWFAMKLFRLGARVAGVGLRVET